MTAPPALARLASRVPPDLWGRIETWLVAFEGREQDTELVIKLKVRKGRVVRAHIDPPEEVVGWPNDKRASA